MNLVNCRRLCLAFVVSSSAAFANVAVPFIAQVLPGDWTDTLNCGPTSVLMVASKYASQTPTSSQINQIDDWLPTHVNGYSINNYNGSATTTAELATLAQQYFGLTSAAAYSGWTESQLQQELVNGYPVIIAVYTYMSVARGHRHFMVLIGMDANFVYVNDPGRSNGGGLAYPIANFRSAWQTKNGNAVVVIHPSAPPAGGIITYDFTGTVTDRWVSGIPDPGLPAFGSTVSGFLSYRYPPPSPGSAGPPGWYYFDDDVSAAAVTGFTSGPPIPGSVVAFFQSLSGLSYNVLGFDYKQMVGLVTSPFTCGLQITLMSSSRMLPLDGSFPASIDPSGLPSGLQIDGEISCSTNGGAGYFFHVVPSGFVRRSP